jgi:hypothetical protein
LVLAACGSESTVAPVGTTAAPLVSTKGAPPVATTAAPLVSTTVGRPPGETAETNVLTDQPYFEFEDGTTLNLDVYYPSSGSGHPLVVLFHGNPVFGATKEGVASLATMIAERGAVVVAPTWGRRMAMGDMHAIARELKTWTRAQGPCAVWAGVDLADSLGAGVSQVVLVGVTTGVLPAQAATFDPPAAAPGCLSQPVPVLVERAILFDTDWLLVPSIWDEVLAQDPAFLEVSAYWGRVDQPTTSRIIMLAGELTAPETVRSLDGKTYEESEWLRIRDPEGRFAGAFTTSGTLEDGSMSFTDVTHVVVSLLVEGGWDAELLIVPRTGHSIAGETARTFVADLVFGD